MGRAAAPRPFWMPTPWREEGSGIGVCRQHSRGDRGGVPGEDEVDPRGSRGDYGLGGPEGGKREPRSPGRAGVGHPIPPSSGSGAKRAHRGKGGAGHPRQQLERVQNVGAHLRPGTAEAAGGAAPGSLGSGKETK